MELLLTAFFTIFIAEMGDKTQLLLVGMAGKYKVRQILIGTWLATAVLNLLAVAVGAALSQYLDMRIIKTIAALAFFYFAWDTLRGDDEEEGESAAGKKLGPVLAIFVSFFIGELGDKTQLTAIALAATETADSLSNAVMVFFGCTAGLILADLLGLLAGLFLKNKLPTGILQYLTFGIFALFGVLNGHEAAELWLPQSTALPWIILGGALLVFLGLCFLTLHRQKKKEKA